jgi:hypothetical protein
MEAGRLGGLPERWGVGIYGARHKDEQVAGDALHDGVALGARRWLRRWIREAGDAVRMRCEIASSCWLYLSVIVKARALIDFQRYQHGHDHRSELSGRI